LGTNQQVYCTAPWNGLTIREDGHVRTCCSGATSLGDLNKISINEIESATALANIRQKMLGGLPDLDNCKSCINQEKQSGLAPLRQYYNRYYSTIDEFKLKFVDIRWNNTCNLACMYCEPQLSSTWSNKLNVLLQKPVKLYQDELLEWILEKIDHTQEIMLVGGEPMLMKQNYSLLSRLPEDCQISIITNLSYDLEGLPCLKDLLRRPKDKIIWNVSFENLKSKFEYVRQGASWTQIEKNLQFITKHWPNTVAVNVVYSLFSAFDLPEFIQYTTSMNIKKFTLFSITKNYTIDVFNMPDSIRELALKELKLAKQYQVSSLHPEDRELYPMQGIDTLISSLKKPAKQIPTLAEFNKQILWYDQWSEVKFADLWPNLVCLVEQELV
jgi:organic radical activating enzyme